MIISVGGDVGKSEHLNTVGEREYNMVQPLSKTVWRLFKKLEIGLAYNSAIPSLGTYLKKISQGNICILVFIATLFTLAKILKQSKCSRNE